MGTSPRYKSKMNIINAIDYNNQPDAPSRVLAPALATLSTPSTIINAIDYNNQPDAPSRVLAPALATLIASSTTGSTPTKEQLIEDNLTTEAVGEGVLPQIASLREAQEPHQEGLRNWQPFDDAARAAQKPFWAAIQAAHEHNMNTKQAAYELMMETLRMEAHEAAHELKMETLRMGAHEAHELKMKTEQAAQGFGYCTKLLWLLNKIGGLLWLLYKLLWLLYKIGGLLWLLYKLPWLLYKIGGLMIKLFGYLFGSTSYLEMFGK